MARQTPSGKDKVVLVLGCFVVLIGLLGFIGANSMPWSDSVRQVYQAILFYAWPAVIIATCLFLIIAVRKGLIVPPTGRPLMRTRSGRVIAGVCSGIAKSFDLRTGWFRVLAVLLIFASRFTFIAIYVALWILMPDEPQQSGAML